MLEKKLIEYPELNRYIQRHGGGIGLVLLTNAAKANSEAFIKEYRDVEAKLGPDLLRRMSLHRETDFISP